MWTVPIVIFSHPDAKTAFFALAWLLEHMPCESRHSGVRFL
jgi:hypothetical protein